MDQKTPPSPTASSGEDTRRVLVRDPSPHLFRPVTFRSVTARNRIMVSPMCQYSATDGVPDDWHFQHLASRAVGGAGFVFTEVAHVEPRGRITPWCLGIWNDAQRDALARITGFLKAQGAVAGIQIGHAGRKGSAARPWEGGKGLTAEQGGWDVIAPSALPFSETFPTPVEMDESTIAAHDGAFRGKRAPGRAGGIRRDRDPRRARLSHLRIPVADIQPAHGSLWRELRESHPVPAGGMDAVRSEWPADKPLFVRLSCTDYMEGGWGLEDSVRLAQVLKSGGKVDLIDCSSGGVDPRQKMAVHPGYQVPFSAAIRARAGIATGAVGLIYSPDMAEQVLANGQADIVIMARAMLNDPYWPLHAAKALKAKIPWPKQDQRGDIF